jgi:hypothetical protein
MDGSPFYLLYYCGHCDQADTKFSPFKITKTCGGFMFFKAMAFLVCLVFFAVLAQQKLTITKCDDTFIISPIAIPPDYVKDPEGGKSKLLAITNYKC